MLGAAQKLSIFSGTPFDCHLRNGLRPFVEFRSGVYIYSEGRATGPPEDRYRSWIFVSPIAGLVSSASTSRRRCSRPDASPTISRSPVWSDSATNHATFPSEGGYLFPAFQVPEPQRSVTRSRNSPEQVRHQRHGPDLSVWPSSVRIVWPLSRSQSRSVRSLDAETARSPSGVSATALTRSLWPSRVRITGPPGSVRLDFRGRSQGQTFLQAACVNKDCILG